MVMKSMTMLEMLREKDAVLDGKDDVRCGGHATMFQVIECELDCVSLISRSQASSTCALRVKTDACVNRSRLHQLV